MVVHQRFYLGEAGGIVAREKYLVMGKKRQKQENRNKNDYLSSIGIPEFSEGGRFHSFYGANL
jgi:hypothetical protein